MIKKQKIIAFSSIILLLALWLTANEAFALGKSWSQAPKIDPFKHQIVDYQWLKGTGDAQYYRIDVNKVAPLRLQVSVPVNSPSLFMPQVAWFEPSSDTIGPSLPIDQPTNTIALIYPRGTPKQVFDIFTQTSYTNIIDIQPEIKTVGTYYLAVYNFGRGDGRYRLMMDQFSPIAQWADAWILPVRWWQDQMFVGFGWQTCITPLLIGLLAWWLWIRLGHHQLRPTRKKLPVAKKPGQKGGTA